MRKKLTALIVVDLFLFIVVFFPALRKYRRVTDGTEELLREKQKLLQKLEYYEREEKNLKTELMKLKQVKNTRLFHGDQGLVDLRGIINEALAKAGVSFSGLNFSRPSYSSGTIYQIQISIPGINTTYLRLRRLIYYLENSKKMIVIKNISISRGKGGRISATMNLEAYFNET